MISKTLISPFDWLTVTTCCKIVAILYLSLLKIVIKMFLIKRSPNVTFFSILHFTIQQKTKRITSIERASKTLEAGQQTMYRSNLVIYVPIKQK